MIHVLLRIAVWVTVFGVAYLVFGPQLFDSSRNANPFESGSEIFLPPAKTQRELKYEGLISQRKLGPEESAEYLSLVREREAGFWQQEGLSVEEALSGVNNRRIEHLAAVLEQRGLSKEESTIFLMVVKRDRPDLLEDRE